MIIIIFNIKKMAEIPKNHQDVIEFSNLGQIINGILIMPTLWSLDNKGRYRYWIIYISIEHNNETIDITDEYINRKSLPSGAYAVYWTESGVENTPNPIISAKTIIQKGKNEKNKNYTTPLTQAILDARSEFNTKIKKGSNINKDSLSNNIVNLETLMLQTDRGAYPWRVFAMAIHDVNKNKNWRHIIYPCKIQPKLDGTMFIVVYNPNLPEIKISFNDNQKKVRMDAYSRGRESYEKQDHILYELYPVLKNYPGLHLVGELWKSGFGLQDISGLSRRQLDSKKEEDDIKLDFNIFDCFSLDSPNMSFEEREATIDDIMMDLSDSKYIKQVPSYEVENKEQLDKKYQEFLEEKMEGGVIRNLNSLYEFGLNGEKRSYTTLKIKPRPDAEWPIVGYKDGNGKESGAVIWICAENDEGVVERTGELLDLDKRKTFSVTPNMSYDIRKEIFQKLKTTNLFAKIKGQLVTINYSILSKDLLPQQPKMLRFRDPKIEILISNEN